MKEFIENIKIKEVLYLMVVYGVVWLFWLRKLPLGTGILIFVILNGLAMPLLGISILRGNGGETAIGIVLITVIVSAVAMFVLPFTNLIINKEVKVPNRHIEATVVDNGERLDKAIDFIRNESETIKNSVSQEYLYIPLNLEEAIILDSTDIDELIYNIELRKEFVSLEKMVPKDIYEKYLEVRANLKDKGLYIHFNNGANKVAYSKTGFGLEVIEEFRKDVVTENNDNYLIITTYP